MAEIRQLQCPTYGASVPTEVGALRATCQYCHSPLAVTVDHGEMVLHSTEKLAGVMREEGERTQAAFQRMLLGQQRAHLVQDYNLARGQLDALDAELRFLK